MFSSNGTLISASAAPQRSKSTRTRFTLRLGQTNWAFNPLSFLFMFLFLLLSPQWGAADSEIKVPFDENTELKGSPFKAWSRSVYSYVYYAYCQGFLPC